jgi:phage baseplate assembly protein W
MPYKSLEITTANVVEQQRNKTSQFYKGFSTLNPRNTSSKLYDLELIKQDILNQFTTRKGERLMNPNFGCIIWDVLMEPLTSEVRQALNDNILEICSSDPRVVPTGINLSEYPTGYIIEITLKLKGSDQSTNMILTFDQELGLGLQ